MKNIKIPTVKPSEFDDYLFANWKAPVTSLYENFHVSRIEDYKNHLKLPTPPHRRSVYFFLFITNGQVVRRKDLTKFELKRDSCFCLSADQITSIDFVSQDATGFYMHFLPEIFNHPNLKVDLIKDFPFFSNWNEPHFEINDDKKIKNLFEMLIKEHLNENKEVLPFYLMTLLSEIKNLAQINQNKKQDASSILTYKYKNALSEFIYSKKTVSEYADYLSVTPNHLLKCVKNTTGKTAHELLDEMRILESKVLLKQTDKSISEIADAIGKEDPSDFSRFFKLKTGQTPNQYRKA
ncbi:AraC family transcriptional regulator [Lacihabitans sp. CS3-21]|uniref:helix-turn-helix domain-containing protein n=1 Tax=Lacihabitans sp. CS3-21 TaxID=2487332 RepID=UPI0020CE95DA|nr:helix-turn-helix transcriptional regulator [Lacihabitans sp. CS3-21]MCP9747332.1 AraC family transcriptional regulator [Lacihabitans sp. CS3-21]